MNKKVITSFIAASALASTLFGSVLATVNGEEVTKADIDLIARQMTQGQKSYDDIPEEYKRKIVEGAVTKKLLIQWAFKNGIEKNEDYLRALNAAKGDIALQAWQKQELDDIQVSEKEAKAFYDENIKTLTQPEQIKASHILVKTEEEANKIINDLKKTSKEKLAGEFAEAAKKYSTGPSAPRGGDLGVFGKDQMVKEFSDAAFGLNVGEMTLKPVKTNFGYHIIYLAEKKNGGTVAYDDVKSQMLEGAKMKKFKEKIDKKIEELTKKAKIKYN